MDFIVVYDITHAAFTGWIFHATSLVLFCIIAFAVFLFLKFYFYESVAEYLHFLIFPFIWIIALGILWDISIYKTYLDVKNNYINNISIKIVEGYVVDVNLQYGRINKQSFQIGKERFEISENIYTGGFDKTVQNGGPIIQGLYVKLYYYEKADMSKVICRVEILK
jgi:hypothetical protein